MTPPPTDEFKCKLSNEGTMKLTEQRWNRESRYAALFYFSLIALLLLWSLVK